jgi:hypothetical protein
MEVFMEIFGRMSLLLLLLAATTLSLNTYGVSYAGEDVEAGTTSVNFIANVASYPPDYLSGSMALHALHSVLRTQGISGTYNELVGISGSVFKVVYDSTEAFEPLRDACPFDLLQTVAVRSGFPDAHWETGLTGDDLRVIIKQEIDAGRPLVSPFLKPDAYHGFNIITGYDYDENQFRVQGAFDRRRSYRVPIPESWDGPTMSPVGWATNPVFVLGEASEDSATMGDVYADMADQAVEMLRGGPLAYGTHEGEDLYMAGPGPHQARYGLPAYDLLIWDVEHGDIVRRSPDGDMLNFGLLWRIDAMVGLLEHDRRRGPEFASVLRGVLSQQQSTAFYDLVVNFKRAADEAAELRDLFWHQVPDTLEDPESVLEYADNNSALVFALPDREGLAADLKSMGREVYESLWGWVMVEDAPRKRLGAKMKVISLRSRDIKCLDLMERLAVGISSRTGRRWPPRKWQPTRLKQE